MYIVESPASGHIAPSICYLLCAAHKHIATSLLSFQVFITIVMHGMLVAKRAHARWLTPLFSAIRDTITSTCIVLKTFTSFRDGGVSFNGNITISFNGMGGSPSMGTLLLSGKACWRKRRIRMRHQEEEEENILLKIEMEKRRARDIK